MEDTYGSAAVICTAVEVESESVLQTFGPWNKVHVPGDEQVYHTCTFLDRHGRLQHLVTCQQDVMGMVATCALASKATSIFHPRYLLMGGIAAGLGKESDQLYGDVLVPNVVWDYSTGKVVGPNESIIRYGEVGFLPRPMSLRLDPELERIMERLCEPGACDFHVQVGPLACGTSVMANEAAVDARVRVLLPTTTGLDMESYAIFHAARTAREPRPKPLVAKSVCDFADGEKTDEFQRFAAFTSSRFIEYLLTRELDFE